MASEAASITDVAPHEVAGDNTAPSAAAPVTDSEPPASEAAVAVTLPPPPPPAIPDQTGSPTYLTSHAVPKVDSGDYPWQVADWMIPHEAIRRDFIRAAYALERMDVIARPWQAHAFKSWMVDFLFTAVHTHHDTEETIVGPYWIALGEKIEFGVTYNHEIILSRMESTSKLALAMDDAVKALGATPTSEQVAAAVAAFNALKLAFLEVQSMLFVHLGEEETFWPSIFMKHTKKEAKAMVDKIISHELKQTGKALAAFKGFTGAIMDAMTGESNECAPAWALRMGPWCNPAYHAEFMNAVPWVPRTLIFPAWHKEYVSKWKAMIDACAGEENMLGIDSTGYPAPAPGACASCCTVQ